MRLAHPHPATLDVAHEDTMKLLALSVGILAAWLIVTLAAGMLAMQLVLAFPLQP